jgi:hypothetical protein
MQINKLKTLAGTHCVSAFDIVELHTDMGLTGFIIKNFGGM